MHPHHLLTRLLCGMSVFLGLATSAQSQNAWEVVPTDVSSNQRAVSAYNQSWPALSTWEAEAGGVVFRTVPSGNTLQFSCDKVATGGFVNYVTLSVFSDSGCTQLVTSGWAYAGSPSVSANAISGQAGTFYCVLSSLNGGGNTYLRHTTGITVKAAPVDPAKTGLELIGPSADQLPGKTFSVAVKTVAVDGTKTAINATSSLVSWTFDSSTFTRSGSSFTVQSAATTSTQTISASYTTGGRTLTGSCTVQVVKPVVTALSLTGPTTAQALNASFTPRITATLSTGTAVNVPATTSTLVWDKDTAVLSQTAGTFKVIGNAVSTTTIGVTFNGVTGSLVVPIKTAPATVTELIVTPSSPTLEVGGGSFTPGLAARKSDGSVVTLTATSSGVTWSVGSVFTRNTTTGAFSVKPGTTATSGNITAKYGNKTAVLAVTITRQPTVTGIRIEPIADQPKGAVFTPVVKKMFSDGRMAVLGVADVTLTSDSTALVVKKPQGQIQVSTTTTATSGTITAQFGTYTATATVNIIALDAASGLVARARALIPKQWAYPAPVPGCIGANAFVLEAAGFANDTTIKTPYSLYQFFETQGKARQRASGEEGAALLAALPHGAVVFFMDPSMNLPWKRPLTSTERSIIVSRKAYGDVGIWDAEKQVLINLTNGFKIGEDNLVDMYDHWGTGTNFTSKFVYGWVSASDFISGYSLAKAQAYQTSSAGETIAGVVASDKWKGRFYYSNQATPDIFHSPQRSRLTLTQVDTPEEVVKYVQTHPEFRKDRSGYTEFVSSEGSLSLTQQADTRFEAFILTTNGILIIPNVPGSTSIQTEEGTLTINLLGGYRFQTPDMTMISTANQVTFSSPDGTIVIPIDSTGATYQRANVPASMVDLSMEAVEYLAENLPYDPRFGLNLAAGSLDNLVLNLEIIRDGFPVVFKAIVLGQEPDPDTFRKTIQVHEEEFLALDPYFTPLGIDRSSAAYFVGTFIDPTLFLGPEAVELKLVSRGNGVVDIVTRTNTLVRSFTQTELTQAASSASRILGGWGIPSKLIEHVERHGRDFGLASSDWPKYVQMSQDFLQHSRSTRLAAKVDDKGVIRIWEESTNTFGVFNPDGTTVTFYKPTSPTYWSRVGGTLTTNY